MTSITYSWDGKILDFSAVGHAEYGKPDIVCASVSTLCCTLLQCMQMLEEQGKLVRYGWGGGSGDFVLDAEVQPYAVDEAGAYIRMALTGLEMLSEQYPKHVKISEKKAEDA